MKKLLLFLLVPASALAGPYIEIGIDYDPDPAFRKHRDFDDEGKLVNTTRTDASHYIAASSIGWEWEKKEVFSADDSVTFRLKAFEHRSDPMNDGSEDIISDNEIRGVSVKYRFW